MRGRRHDHDAGGPRALLAQKAELREAIWGALRDARVARFPGAQGRIPHFVGAEAAAELLRSTPAWRRARVLKCNPDAPQRPVRERALADGKLLFMAAPRLAADQPFVRLDPKRIASARAAASIRGAAQFGEPVSVDELAPVDLVVVGCVAVSPNGARLGKGGGYADLELAVAAEAGLIAPKTRVVTTVHDLQLVDVGRIPTTEHDAHVDLIVTPTRIVRCPRKDQRPRIHWDELTAEKIASIPLLQQLQRH